MQIWLPSDNLPGVLLGCSWCPVCADATGRDRSTAPAEARRGDERLLQESTECINHAAPPNSFFSKVPACQREKPPGLNLVLHKKPRLRAAAAASSGPPPAAATRSCCRAASACCRGEAASTKGWLGAQPGAPATPWHPQHHR